MEIDGKKEKNMFVLICVVFVVGFEHILFQNQKEFCFLLNKGIFIAIDTTNNNLIGINNRHHLLDKETLEAINKAKK